MKLFRFIILYFKYLTVFNILFQVLRPSCNLRAMRLWSSVYMSGTVVLDTRYEDAVEATATEEKPESLPLQKTR